MNSKAEYTAIGTLTRSVERGSTLDNIEELEKFFLKHHIECRIHGSRVYAIEVPKQRTEEAMRLLKRSEFKDRIIFLSKMNLMQKL